MGRMKIASWNVNSLNVRLAQVQQWLAEFSPDVLGLQETKLEDSQFPDTRLLERGWRSVFSGQKTYNGVALLAKQALQSVQTGIPDEDNIQKRAIAATVNGVRIINLYVVNGQDIGTDKYQWKLRWLEAAHRWIAAELQQYRHVVVLGDFNIAPDERDVFDPDTWNEQHILTSRAERAALQRLLALGLHDSLRLHNQAAGVFSWWDYRAFSLRRNLGLRIDLILVSEALKSHVIAAGVDKQPRLWERPSDHAPVYVELDL